jgi:hypothetical protein
VDDAEEVGVHDLVEVGGVGPGAAEADAGVEGEEVDFPYRVMSKLLSKDILY